MHMHMSSRNVAIQTAVYDALDKEKRRGESFTELFVRLLNQRGTADELRGAWGSAGTAEDHRRLARLRRARAGRPA
jgi:predicted CopG family antitoxin